MKTQLFIRFFKNQDDGIPTDSYRLPQIDYSILDYIEEWMKRFPKGKVDFVNIKG